MRVGIIGDVHGHERELIEMLGTIEAHGVDRLVLLGDLVDRGPDSRGCLQIARTWSFSARDGERALETVKGNHEDAYVRVRDQVPKPGRDYIETPENRWLYEHLSADELTWMASLPSHLCVPELNLALVHGGVTPHMDALEEAGDYMLRTRYLDDRYYELRSTQSSDVFWADIYDGRFGTIVFGHESHRDVTQYEHAIAVDGEGYRRLHGVIISNEPDDRWLTVLTLDYGGKQPMFGAPVADPVRLHDYRNRNVRWSSARKRQLWSRDSHDSQLRFW
jgi:predicted phosphodiesterase